MYTLVVLDMTSFSSWKSGLDRNPSATERVSPGWVDAAAQASCC